MDIKQYKLLEKTELLHRIKETQLKGFDNARVYENSSIDLIRNVNPNDLVPSQRYVLKNGCDTIEDIYNTFKNRDINVFALEGILMFTPNNDKDENIPFIPPVIEESIEPNGKIVWLINDGIHRVFTARKLGLPINIILVRNVPKEYPYYAYALENGWDDVEELVELPDTYQKKTYRDPDNYKSLFRQFNVQFPGIQADRKKSNPSNIKA